MGRLWVTLAVAILLAGSSAAVGQATITKFGQVAGQWTGHASSHRVSLAIDPDGRFTAKSALGSETGDARLEEGMLIIPLVEHHGTLRLLLQGEELKGSGVLRGTTWKVSLLRLSQR
jgi:hypothetical protein